MIPTLLYFTLGLLLVLLLRRPVRHLFGAGPAFTLWLWPWLLAALPWLPLPAPSWSVLPPVLARMHTLAPAGATSASAGTPLWAALWIGGSMVALLRLVLCYTRLRRSCRPMPAKLLDQLVRDQPQLDPRRLRLHPQGPAVLWSWRSLMLLPADLFERFDRAQCALVVAHEHAHLQRRDPLWSLLAEATAAVLWFHPLTWLALPRFRLDLELACDERTLRMRPADEAAYARTLLLSTRMEPSAVLIPWLAEPQLKERLMMIRRERATSIRRRAGYLGLATAAFGLCLAVQATSPVKGDSSPPSQDIANNLRIMPQYPKTSIDNKEHGTVVLRILVAADGTPKAIDYDAQGSSTASASLIGAARDAAMQWRFQPAMKNGQATEGYVRVPVRFDLGELPDGAGKPGEKSPT